MYYIYCTVYNKNLAKKSLLKKKNKRMYIFIRDMSFQTPLHIYIQYRIHTTYMPSSQASRAYTKYMYTIYSLHKTCYLLCFATYPHHPHMFYSQPRECFYTYTKYPKNKNTKNPLICYDLTQRKNNSTHSPRHIYSKKNKINDNMKTKIWHI